jgi:hypothetical protein
MPAAALAKKLPGHRENSAVGWIMQGFDARYGRNEIRWRSR